MATYCVQTVLELDMAEVKPKYLSLLLSLLSRVLCINDHYNIVQVRASFIGHNLRHIATTISWLVVWLSSNALVVITKVTLRQARLILGWVTVCGQVHHLGM